VVEAHDSRLVRLAAAEYVRGLLSWQPIPGIEIQIGTAPDAATAKDWSPQLGDPSGSLVPIELQPIFAFKIWLKGKQTTLSLPEF